MDMGIAGKTALVCAASKGLGKGCARALAREGANLVITARSADVLAATAKDIAEETGVSVTPVTGDITTEEGRAAALAVCPEPDILVNNAGGPPPGDFRDWRREDWIAAVDANMITPIEMIRLTVDSMLERKWGRIVNITSGAVKAPLETLGLSNGARSGLTGFVAGLARKTVRDGVTINNLLPGPFDTDRIHTVAAQVSQKTGRQVEDILEERRSQNPAGRFGDPDEFGAACAFLCSRHAGYITGQNMLMDGGAYPGTF